MVKSVSPLLQANGRWDDGQGERVGGQEAGERASGREKSEGRGREGERCSALEGGAERENGEERERYAGGLTLLGRGRSVAVAMVVCVCERGRVMHC